MTIYLKTGLALISQMHYRCGTVEESHLISTDNRGRAVYRRVQSAQGEIVRRNEIRSGSMRFLSNATDRVLNLLQGKAVAMRRMLHP